MSLETDKPACASLVARFGDAWHALPEQHKLALVDDVRGIAHDETRSLHNAVAVLAERIGGARNLRRYADCLVVQP